MILHASTDDNARAVKVAYTQQEFIETLAPTAQKMSKNYGVPASILLSQAAYESNYGIAISLYCRYYPLNEYVLDLAEQGDCRCYDI